MSKPDSSFIRGNVPMTKSEIRCLTLDKANISKNSIIWDIGAGTGSISIEACLIASAGTVYAIEQNQEGVELIRKNASKFNLENIKIIKAKAPEGMSRLPDPDVVIIGGSGGNFEEIFNVAADKLKAGGRIVINGVTLNTVQSAVNLLTKSSFKIDISLVAITKLTPLKDNFFYKAHNPIHIIQGIKEG